MMSVYLDNAATTPVDPEVFEAMVPWLTGQFGNPSSTHSHGRESRSAIEMSRKKIADLLHALPGEIYFTSGGTEGDNTLLHGAIMHPERTHAITSTIEHHAVLHTLEEYADSGITQLNVLEPDNHGNLNYEHLERLLSNSGKSVVSLMYANNEIGKINDMSRISDICKTYDAFFHSDTVQAMGHYKINTQEMHVDAMVCSAHKIHGPKGIGFMYLRKGHKINPYMLGGGQERSMRGGTENVAGIVGLAKAFELAHERMDDDETYIRRLKNRMIDGLKKQIPDIEFNGHSEREENLYTVLNVSFPPSTENDFLMFNLDMKGISVSGGSACNSGADKGSHVLSALNSPENRLGVRFSFSRMNTEEDIDSALAAIKEIYL